jgi:hypothetical protein
MMFVETKYGGHALLLWWNILVHDAMPPVC